MLAWNPSLRPSGGGFTPFARTLGGGPALNSDFEQVVPQQSQRWRASIRLSVRSTEEIFALREMVMSLEGRANTIAVPVFDRGRAPWRVDQYGRSIDPGFVRQRSLDGTQFADSPGLVDGLISAKLNAAAALRASQVAINIVSGSAPQVGMFFSIGTRLYNIKAIVGVAGSVSTVKIWPLLRADVAVNTVVNFTSPSCEMRFQTDDQGQDILSALDQFRFAAGTLAFEEIPVS